MQDPTTDLLQRNLKRVGLKGDIIKKAGGMEQEINRERLKLPEDCIRPLVHLQLVSVQIFLLPIVLIICQCNKGSMPF